MILHADNMSVDAGFDALDYGYAPGAGQATDPGIRGERNLWCAVIAQAFMDIGAVATVSSGRRPGGARVQDKAFDDAVRWLLRDTASFAHICDLAGVSPFIIRRAAQVFYTRIRPSALSKAPAI